MIDVADRADREADYQVTVADIEQAEARDGQIPATPSSSSAPVSRRWPDAVKYLGRPSVERRPSRSFTSRDCIPTPRAGWWQPQLRPSASTGQHQLRSVDAIRIAPRALRTRRPRLREPDCARAAATARCHGHRATDEDRRRQRCPVAGDRDSAVTGDETMTIRIEPATEQDVP